MNEETVEKTQEMEINEAMAKMAEGKTKEELVEHVLSAFRQTGYAVEMLRVLSSDLSTGSMREQMRRRARLFIAAYDKALEGAKEADNG